MLRYWIIISLLMTWHMTLADDLYSADLPVRSGSASVRAQALPLALKTGACESKR